MGNIQWVSYRKTLAISQLADVCRSTVDSLWGDLGRVQEFEHSLFVEVQDKSGDWIPIADLYLYSARRLGSKHPSRLGDVGDWFFASFMNRLAWDLGGSIGDEGVRETWPPDLRNFTSFRDWLDRRVMLRPLKVRRVSRTQNQPEGLYGKEVPTGGVPRTGCEGQRSPQGGHHGKHRNF